MKIDFDQAFRDLLRGGIAVLDGDALVRPGEDGKPAPAPALSLRSVAMNVLANAAKGDADKPGMGRRCFDLMSKLYTGGVVDLTSEEAALIKGRIEMFYPPMITGAAAEMLDQRDPYAVLGEKVAAYTKALAADDGLLTPPPQD